MAEEDGQRKYGDYFLVVLVIFYVIFAVGIIAYGVVLRNQGHQEGLFPMYIALGIDAHVQMLSATGAFSLITGTCFVIGLCLAPRWGCWFIVGCLFLIFAITINIYLVCEMLIGLKYDWGTRDYLWNLDYSTQEGKDVWNSLQSHYECCGVLDEDEWDVKPASCPSFEAEDDRIHGCSPKFAAIRRNRTIVLVVILLIAVVLEVLGAIGVYIYLWPYFMAYREEKEEGVEEEEEEEEDDEEEEEDELSEPSDEEIEHEARRSHRGEIEHEAGSHKGVAFSRRH